MRGFALFSFLSFALLALTACKEEQTHFTAPGLETPVDAAGLSTDSFRVIPEVLNQVYAAFGATDEAAIYDGLAQVAAGEALEALYLERIGAMATAGLEPDQTIHEMEMLGLVAATSGAQVSVSAKWRVLGTVGHAEHLHVRGNTYSAELVLEPVEEAWRLTGFSLTDVDRSDAGSMVASGIEPAPEEAHDMVVIE